MVGTEGTSVGQDWGVLAEWRCCKGRTGIAARAGQEGNTPKDLWAWCGAGLE